MTMHTQHPLLPLIGRPLLGAGTLVFALLLLSGCGGGSGGSGTANAPATSASCAKPDTHCAPQP